MVLKKLSKNYLLEKAKIYFFFINHKTYIDHLLYPQTTDLKHTYSLPSLTGTQNKHSYNTHLSKQWHDNSNEIQHLFYDFWPPTEILLTTTVGDRKGNGEEVQLLEEREGGRGIIFGKLPLSSDGDFQHHINRAGRMFYYHLHYQAQGHTHTQTHTLLHVHSLSLALHKEEA